MACFDKKNSKAQAVKKDEIPRYKILIVGESGVGKTSIIYQYLHGPDTHRYEVHLANWFEYKTVTFPDG